MEFIGKPLSGGMLHNAHINAIDECTEVKAAIAYAQQSVDKILLFDDCVLKGKKLTFYGRVDGTCPIDLRILDWFLRRNSPNAICKLVPHWLHAKVIWWVGQGAYIGSANLTDRAWFNNFEAGVYLIQEELDAFGLILELEEFFDGLEQEAIPLNNEEYERQVALQKKRAEILRKLQQVEREFEDQHWKLKDRTTPIAVSTTRKSKDKRMAAFKQEWNETLQLIRSVGARASLDENRPNWIADDVPQGVQGDQFLHAYYYQMVRPNSERNAYLREFNKNQNNPEAALQAALAWWKSGTYEHEHEEGTIYQSAPLLRDLFGKGRIKRLNEQEWVIALTHIYAFGDHAAKVPNSYLGLGSDPGSAAKGVALAHILWNARTTNGISAPEVFDFVIWGKGDVADRIWTASHEREFKLPHIGTNILGEAVGWARPTEYPPRNARTSKALRALGNSVEVFV